METRPCPMGETMKDRLRKILIPLAFWLLLWALCAAAVGKELLLPSPGAVFHALLSMVTQGDFWHAALLSLGRVSAGFAIGAAVGMALGGLTAASRWCDELFSPALRAVRTVPVVSFILLLFFWLPTGQVPVAVAALMALPVVWRSTRQGLSAAAPQLLELSGAYGMSPWRTFRLIRLPAALPALSAGWETALGLSWKSGVAAEVLCQPKWAAGTGLQTAKAYLESPRLFAWTAVIVALSLGMEALLKRALKDWRAA